MQRNRTDNCWKPDRSPESVSTETSFIWCRFFNMKPNVTQQDLTTGSALHLWVLTCRPLSDPSPSDHSYQRSAVGLPSPPSPHLSIITLSPRRRPYPSSSSSALWQHVLLCCRRYEHTRTGPSHRASWDSVAVVATNRRGGKWREKRSAKPTIKVESMERQKDGLREREEGRTEGGEDKGWRDETEMRRRPSSLNLQEIRFRKIRRHSRTHTHTHTLRGSLSVG